MYCLIDKQSYGLLEIIGMDNPFSLKQSYVLKLFFPVTDIKKYHLVFRTDFNWNFTGESPDIGRNKNHSIQHDKDKSKYSRAIFLSVCIQYN